MQDSDAHPIDDTVRAEILVRLKRAEEEHDVKILHAVESGSRAWGFASPDSDYDVRFIYAHKQQWYLSFDVERQRDVIEYPIVDEIDCGGWDLRKALYLFTRTNGALLEWLSSPIVYGQLGSFASRLRELAPRHINYIALCYHYSHMARGNAREYLFKDKARLKKYFYVLRPLLAIRYIQADLGVPPMEFEKLVEAVAPEAIRPGIARLLIEKRKTSELGYGEPIPEINHFIEAELERHGDTFKGQGRPDLLKKDELRAELNEIYRTTLNEVEARAV